MRIIRHHWKEIVRGIEYHCDTCGCVKKWDFDFGRIVYSGNLFRAPECKTTFHCDKKQVLINN